MKYLPLIGVFLWVSFFGGILFQPGVFLQAAVKYPATLFLAIILTVSFWELQALGKKLFALLMVGMLFLYFAATTYCLAQTFSAIDKISDYHGGRVSPALIELLTSIDRNNKRTLTDKLFYGHQGVPLPFLAVEQEIARSSADKKTKVTLSHIMSRSTQILSAKREVTHQIYIMFFLLLLGIITFSALIIYLILYDKQNVASDA
ncbi:MAG: hypothetical protein D6B25_05680 [Desulfobulbaceae bacterium]|nr:MAG: hypothetical protein D6B25_05680 [Desulfobulbaceae bacterium]